MKLYEAFNFSQCKVFINIYVTYSGRKLTCCGHLKNIGFKLPIDSLSYSRSFTLNGNVPIQQYKYIDHDQVISLIGKDDLFFNSKFNQLNVVS